MNRIKLEVAYDGSAYCGWQIQPAQPTIEGQLNKALSDLLKEEIKVIGASRTDAGVHSQGNIAVFDTNSNMPADRYCFALNARLPEDIRVVSSCAVANDFHPRHVDSRKTYHYTIFNRRIPDPTQRLYSYHVYYDLDLALMEEAAKYLIGEHDFKSFCSVKTQVLDTVRTIYQLKVTRDVDKIIISVTGSGFLYNMVRIIAGTLIEVGRGAYPPEHIANMLQGCDRTIAGPTAPPQGLMLMNIQYD